MEFTINADLVFTDMALEDELRQKCRSIFFQGMENGKGVNFIVNEIYPFIKNSTGIFPKSLLSYMSEKHSKKDFDPFELLHVYVQTYSIAYLVRPQQETSRSCGEGLEIMVAHADCPICQQYDGVKYTWNNLKQMPTIPLHWGCACAVSVFFK